MTTVREIFDSMAYGPAPEGQAEALAPVWFSLWVGLGLQALGGFALCFTWRGQGLIFCGQFRQLGQ